MMSKPNIIIQLIAFIGRKFGPKRVSVKQTQEDLQWPTDKNTIGYEVLLEKMREGTHDDVETSWMKEMKRRHDDPVKRTSKEKNRSYRIGTTPNFSL